MRHCKNIDHDQKIIFLHPNRCGGKSIEKIIFDRDPKNGSADHSLPKHYISKFGESIWQEYYKFGFSRNPWDRVASLYFYRKNNLKNFPFYTLKEYLLYGKEQFPHDFITQTEYFYYNGVLINFVGKLEKYNIDFLTIKNRLKLTNNLPKLNQSQNRLDYKKLFDNETQKIVEKKFQKDIQNFEYNF